MSTNNGLSTPHVLLVEDDQDLQEALCETLRLADIKTTCVGCAEDALVELTRCFDKSDGVNMVITDVNMPGMDGYDLLKNIKQSYPCLPVLMMTAYGSVDRAIEAIRIGAIDYLVKPFSADCFIETVNRFVTDGVQITDSNEPIVRNSESKKLLNIAKKLAKSDTTVLIAGESGTGKEVLSKFIHANSPRADQPFVAINCAAIPENMLEATLFGYEKGAFTGAYNSVPGKFEQANGGTLLLDEISEMDLSLQAKILRVLQEKEVERLGGRKILPLDVRIIATTNRDIHQEVINGRFREDLYYRLSVFPLSWKPLRERTEDIMPLASYLLQINAEKMNKTVSGFDDSAKIILEQHSWPGNVRELDNVIQRALVLLQGHSISEDELIINTVPVISSAREKCDQTFNNKAELPDDIGQLGEGVQQREFQIIVDALKEQRGCRKETAKKLGISPRTLRYKLAKMRDSGINIDGTLGVAFN